MPNEILFVPVEIDFLLVDSSGMLLEKSMSNFSKLPYIDASGNKINADLAYISNNFVSPPFQKEKFYLKQGVHLHWSLPDTFKRGFIQTQGAEKSVQHPDVPDRWIINRRRKGTIEKSWIVESNYLKPQKGQEIYEPISYPVGYSEGQPFRYMGRSYCFYDASKDPTNQPQIPPKDDNASYLKDLTAVGYGEHTFSSFYPNCHSVFGFYDSEVSQQDSLTDLEYEVIGWYGNPQLDVVRDKGIEIYPKLDVINILNYDGRNDYVNCGNAAGLAITGELTIEAWIQFNTKSNINTSQTIVSKKDNRPDRPGYWFYAAISQKRYSLVLETENAKAETLNSFEIGELQHVAVVVEGETASIYVGGVSQPMKNSKVNLTPSSEDFAIGAIPRIMRMYNFSGGIGEVRVWDIARSQREILYYKDKDLASAEPGLIAHYRFNDSLAKGADLSKAQLLDISGNNYHGTLKGFGTNFLSDNWLPIPRRNLLSRGLNFDGKDDYIVCSQSDDLSPTDRMTIEAWINPTSRSGNNNNVICSKRTFNTRQDQPGYSFYLFTQGSTYRVCFESKNSNAKTVSSFEYDVWRHVAVSVDIDPETGDHTISLFVDGKLQELDTNANTVDLEFCDLDFLIGAVHPLSTPFKFNGTIGGLRVWNTARSVHEIQFNMNVDFSDPIEGLIADYKFDQGEANVDNKEKIILIDHSRNNHQGKLIGFGLNGFSSNWVSGNPALLLGSTIKEFFDFNIVNNVLDISTYPNSICYSRLILSQATGKPTKSVDNISLGNTGTEALSTWLSKNISAEASGDNTYIEKGLEALKNQHRINSRNLDQDELLEEVLHENGFSAASGGLIWKLSVESVANADKSNGGKKKGIEIELPDSFAHKINYLNTLQQNHDKAKDELKSLKEVLYYDWCKYMMSSYHSASQTDLPRKDDVKTFIEYIDLDGIDEKNKEIQSIQTTINTELNLINQLASNFNLGNKYNKLILNSDDSVDQYDSAKFPFKKLISEVYFKKGDPDTIADEQLAGVFVKNLEGGNKKGFSITNAGLKDFASISFWINIDGLQIPTGDNPLKLIELQSGTDGIVKEADITLDNVGSYWESIIINGKRLDPYRQLEWNDIPKDRWMHVYMRGPADTMPISEVILMKGLQGRIAGISVFNEGLSTEQLFCNSNMLGLKEMKVDSLKAPRYWQPKEPVILISGEIAETKMKYGYDNELPCILVKSDFSLEFKDIADDSFSGAVDMITFVKNLNLYKDIASDINKEEEKFKTFFTACTNTPIYTQPWNPIMLEWKVGVSPMDLGANGVGNKVDTGLINKHYELGIDQPDLTAVSSSGSRNMNVFTGSTILSPHSKKRMVRTIENYLQNMRGDNDDWKIYQPSQNGPFVNPFINKIGLADEAKIYDIGKSVKAVEGNPITIALSAYVGLKDGHFLSQSLSGFNAALIMLHQIFQIPMADPIGSDKDQEFTAEILDHVEKESKHSPLPDFSFNPLRTGSIKILELNIVDSFGQIQAIYKDASSNNPPINFSRLLKGGQLPPRISQFARLNFRWLSADNDEMEMNSHPSSSPICGWLVPNNLDGSILVYDQDGNAMGSVNSSKPQWRSEPGTTYPISLEQLPNKHLKEVVNRILEIPVLSDFIELLESTLDQIDPENFAQHTDMAMLVSRPIAITRAMVGLEVKGNLAINRSWDAFKSDMKKAISSNGKERDRETNGWEEVNFPIRVGEHGQLNDGVLGFWLDSQPDTFLSAVSVQNNLPFGNSTHSKGYDPKNPHILTSIADDAQFMTLLMDPRAEAHGTCGILPTKLISIPADQYKPALARMSYSFFTRPLLMPEGKTTIPLPREFGYEWTWMTESDKKWREIGTVGVVYKETFEQTFKNGEEIWFAMLNKGWIEGKETSKAYVVPANRRKDPDPKPLLITQLDKIQNILDKGHIINMDNAADFNHTNGFKEGWLKLTPKQ